MQITVAEEEGVGTRAGYYDQSGALRDMVQNHMLQLLALVAMEPPHSLDADVVRDEKLEVIQSLRPIEGDAVDAAASFAAQYAAGFVMGAPVPGYTEEPGVDPSLAHRDIRGAAGLHRQLAMGGRAVLPAHRQAAAEAGERDLDPLQGRAADSVQSRIRTTVSIPNVLTIRIQPDEGFALGISSKVPGPRVRIYPVNMDFRYGSTFGASSPEAYERLLLDVMAGDATLFMRRDSVEASWRWITPILDRWAEQTCGAAADLPRRRLGTGRGRPPRSDRSDGHGASCNRVVAIGGARGHRHHAARSLARGRSNERRCPAR